ncbi:endonuclease/exonuclease/phosphatase family protein [Wenyingzhuangia marina]|uniref:Metal-dependent hydrolase, endonuclease/exonuclease/phosphatase family n=1 Tax=Wenyingzhuangia marina TaxID=1195760 RepID=A0A1M5V4Y9_9FLAO|nr:endonuclease/exonuclease/phosphatase family protein [Wenyingzhuangia marina]GGF74395.1 endonuclease [Wenyingzhuangia marina]SHH70228.1 Metal-dependent hydrolase, endonuclease/exonuclease/phosphatase family [Wenyingzhuangia marina]
MKKLNFFDKFLFFINSLVSILLLFTYALPFIDPEKHPGIAILSLAYPILLIINITFVVFWVVKLKLHFLLSAISILIGLSHIHDFYVLDNKEVIKDSDIKLLSFNVRRFNVYNWIKSPTIKQDICDFVNKENPDIVFFQEYTNEKNVRLNITNTYVYKTSASGIAIYSKYKILNKGAINFKNTANNIIYADLKINKEIVRVYNVHLQSFRIDTQKEHYGDKDNEALVKRFKSVFKEQSHQIKVLKEHIKNCKYRTIVAGDFNNTAFSWNYHEIMEGRKDAFVEAGINFGKSYHYFFPFRIDFILPDNTMEVGKFTTYDVNLSDHYPIMARINLNN